MTFPIFPNFVEASPGAANPNNRLVELKLKKLLRSNISVIKISISLNPKILAEPNQSNSSFSGESQKSKLAFIVTLPISCTKA